LGFDIRTSTIHSEHDVDPDQFEPDIPDEDQAHRHVLDFVPLAWDLKLDYALTDSIILSLNLPILGNSSEASFLDADGEVLPDSFTSIHHRDELLLGLGDVEFGVGVNLLKGDVANKTFLQLKVGFTLPTGKVEPDPFKLGQEGKKHQHMFFGSGTVNPVLGLSFSMPLGPVRLGAWGTGVFVLYSGPYDYQASQIVDGGLGIGVPLFENKWMVIINQDLFYETTAHWGENDAKNSGRMDLIATVGLLWFASDTWNASFTVKVPYMTFTDGHQLEMPVMGSFGLSYKL